MRHRAFVSILLLVSGSALAEFKYSFLELGYMPRTYYEGDYADGQDLRMRFNAGESTFFSLYIAGSEARDDTAGVFFQNETYGLAFGGHLDLRENLSAYLTGGYEHIALKFGAATPTRSRLNGNGYGGEVGLRFKPIERPLELGLEYDYDDYDHSTAQFIEVWASYPFWERYGVTLSYADGEYELDGAGFPDKLKRQDIRIAGRVYW